MQVKILRLLVFFIISFVCCGMVFAQNRVISGKVVDSSTEKPLVGVSIWALGAANGTVTDTCGNFQLFVPVAVRELNFSYLNYTSRRIAAVGSNLMIRMVSEIRTLNEATVFTVGYNSTLNRKEASNAINYACRCH